MWHQQPISLILHSFHWIQWRPSFGFDWLQKQYNWFGHVFEYFRHPALVYSSSGEPKFWVGSLWVTPIIVMFNATVPVSPWGSVFSLCSQSLFPSPKAGSFSSWKDIPQNFFYQNLGTVSNSLNNVVAKATCYRSGHK